MTRRELLILGRNFFVSLFGIALLYGCKLFGKRTSSISSLAYLLAYLLYGDMPPIKEVNAIEKHLRTIAQNSLNKQVEFERLCLRLDLKDEKAFKNLSPDNKRRFVKKGMPVLAKNPEVFNALRQYLQGERVLEYLDYPDLPGDFGECGWLVLEGTVWDRDYHPSGS